MDNALNYATALGALRQQSALWAHAVRATGAAAQSIEPAPQAADDPVAVNIFADIAAEFRSLAVAYPGIRQLFASAIRGV